MKIHYTPPSDTTGHSRSSWDWKGFRRVTWFILIWHPPGVPWRYRIGKVLAFWKRLFWRRKR